jgi:hypothetical protein
MTNWLHRTVSSDPIAPRARDLKANLNARYIAARRWHAEAIRALDASWLAANAEASQAKPDDRLAIWKALESDLAAYFAGVPADNDLPP